MSYVFLLALNLTIHTNLLAIGMIQSDSVLHEPVFCTL